MVNIQGAIPGTDKAHPASVQGPLQGHIRSSRGSWCRWSVSPSPGCVLPFKKKYPKSKGCRSQWHRTKRKWNTADGRSREWEQCLQCQTGLRTALGSWGKEHSNTSAWRAAPRSCRSCAPAPLPQPLLQHGFNGTWDTWTACESQGSGSWGGAQRALTPLSGQPGCTCSGRHWGWCWVCGGSAPSPSVSVGIPFSFSPGSWGEKRRLQSMLVLPQWEFVHYRLLCCSAVKWFFLGSNLPASALPTKGRNVPARLRKGEPSEGSQCVQRFCLCYQQGPKAPWVHCYN